MRQSLFINTHNYQSNYADAAKLLHIYEFLNEKNHAIELALLRASVARAYRLVAMRLQRVSSSRPSQGSPRWPLQAGVHPRLFPDTRVFSCRAAASPAAAPPAPGLQPPVAPTDTTPLLGCHPIGGDWLAYSRRLVGLPFGSEVDGMLEALRRRLGSGGRWAWEEEEQEEESELAEDEAEDEEKGSDAVARLPLVPSIRGRRRRGGSSSSSMQQQQQLRWCRGRPLAGVVSAAQRGGAVAAAAVLPESLRACEPGRLLTAEQEALLGGIVQAAKLAAAEASGGSGSSAHQQLLLAQRRGATAQQLLFDSNLRLVGFVRRRLVGGRPLAPGLFQVGRGAARSCLFAAPPYMPGAETITHCRLTRLFPASCITAHASCIGFVQCGAGCTVARRRRVPPHPRHALLNLCRRRYNKWYARCSGAAAAAVVAGSDAGASSARAAAGAGLGAAGAGSGPRIAAGGGHAAVAAAGISRGPAGSGGAAAAAAGAAGPRSGAAAALGER